MGGLFSSPETPTYSSTPTYHSSPTYRSSPTYSSTYRSSPTYHSSTTYNSTSTYRTPHSSWQDRQRTNHFESDTTYEWERPITRSAPAPQIQALSCVPASRSLRNIILQQDMASAWSTMPYIKEYMSIPISEYSNEYIQVQKEFKSKAPKHFKVIEINRIQNPYLLGCYLLKKHEMQVLYDDVKEMLVFHGTKMCNVEKICTDNFNWRLHGESVGNRFGKGVSFSPKSSYASNYCDKSQERKVMFLVRVLYHKAVQGKGTMELPPSIGYGNKRYDTAVKENSDVIVKFCDNEFYPQYLIYYTGSLYKRRSQNKNGSNPGVYMNLY